jgi:hypothetical protein
MTEMKLNTQYNKVQLSAYLERVHHSVGQIAQLPCHLGHPLSHALFHVVQIWRLHRRLVASTAAAAAASSWRLLAVVKIV